MNLTFHAQNSSRSPEPSSISVCLGELLHVKFVSTCKAFVLTCVCFLGFIISLPISASAQTRTPDSVSENFTPVRSINPVCLADINVIIDGGVGSAGYCPHNGQPTYEITFVYDSPSIDEFYQSFDIYANAGSVFSDGELRIFDLGVDYLNASTGAPESFSVSDVDIGNTLNITDVKPVLFSTLAGLPSAISGISEIRISNIRSVNGFEVALREVQITEAPVDVSLVKTAFLDLGADGSLNAGDLITYTYVVTNESAAATVFNVDVSESSGSFSGTGTLPAPSLFSGGNDYDGGAGTATDLRSGETVTFSAVYAITQADIDANGVTNQAVATGTSFHGQTATDLSGTTSSNDTPTTMALVVAPDISLPPPTCGATQPNFAGLSFSTIEPISGSSDNFRLPNAGTVNGAAVDVIVSFASPGAPGGAQAPRISSGSDNLVFNTGIPRTLTYQIVRTGTTIPEIGNFRFRMGDIDSVEAVQFSSSQVAAILVNSPTNLTIDNTGGVTTITGAPGARSFVPEDAVELILENTSPLTMTVIPPSPNAGFILDANNSTSFTGEACASDVVTEKTLFSATATPTTGATVSYAIDVTNNGTFPVAALTLTDNLPAGLTYSSDTPGATSAGVTTYDDTSGLWTIGMLAGGETVRLILSGTVDAGGVGATFTNVTTAAASPSLFDIDVATDDLSEAVTIIAAPNINAVKTVNLVDPLGFSLPGDDVLYTITISNTGDGIVDVDSIFLVDRIPAEVDVFIGDVDGPGPETDPVSFIQVGSGLTFTYVSDVAFSNNAVQPLSFGGCDYTPSTGYDPNIRFICLNPKGVLAAGDPAPGFSVTFRARTR